jgi:hypothetical protein
MVPPGVRRRDGGNSQTLSKVDFGSYMLFTLVKAEDAIMGNDTVRVGWHYLFLAIRRKGFKKIRVG